jgi:hypothetical protein
VVLSRIETVWSVQTVAVTLSVGREGEDAI